MSRRQGTTVLAVLLASVWQVAPVLGQHGEQKAETPAASHVADSAAEHGGDGHAEEGPNLFTGDLGNIFWSLLTFGLVIFVLGRFAWGPLLTALKKREDFIRDSLAQAKADRQQAEAKLQEYVKKIDDARDEAGGIVEEGRRDAEGVRQRIEREAQSEANAIVERAKREIQIARETAVKGIYDLTAQLVTEVAGKVIRKQLSPSDHQELLRESIQALADMPQRKNGR